MFTAICPCFVIDMRTIAQKEDTELYYSHKQQEWEDFMYGQNYNFLSIIQPGRSI